MRVKAIELNGVALDWAVASAINLPIEIVGESFQSSWLEDRPDGSRSRVFGRYRPSKDWGHAGPIIENLSVALAYPRQINKNQWEAQCWDNHSFANGETALIAACRAMVASRLGDEVEIPGELAEIDAHGG